jgi:hypothetical protein
VKIIKIIRIDRLKIVKSVNYRIIIWTQKMMELFREIRLIEMWNLDTMYRIKEEKEKNSLGLAVITKLGVLMMSKNYIEAQGIS